nr:DUF3667 domain-containing protein [Maribellus sp. YY47]
MWSKIRKRIGKSEKEKASREVVCKNCETVFTGYYCPHCGQSISDFDRPFSFLFYNFVGDFFAFDERFFKTTIDLLFKPGYLTKEYFEGRRVRYAPPFRIFIFASFVLFLLLEVLTNRGLDAMLDADLRDQASAVDSLNMPAVDSMLRVELKDVPVGDSAQLNLNSNLKTLFGGNIRQGMATEAERLEQELKTETDKAERKEKRELIQLLRSPEQIKARILKYMSWAFFLLLPVFALILKLFYIRRNQNYIRHLIFSIHIHSYLFILMILIIGMYLTLSVNFGIVTLILSLTFPIYTIIAMKKFYGQGIGKVVAKFVGMSFIYNTIFLGIFLFVIVEALNL